MAFKLIVFGSLLAASIADQTAASAEEKRDYDAWKTVSQNGTFNMMYRSFEYGEGLGGTAKCVSVKLCNVSNETMTAYARMTYRDPATTTIKGYTTRVTVARSPGSTTNDIIRLGDADRCDAGPNAVTVQYRLVYSDYNTCDTVMLYGTYEKKCELWVREGYEAAFENATINASTPASIKARSDQDINAGFRKCEKAYRTFCGDVKYNIYDKHICSSTAEAAETKAEF